MEPIVFMFYYINVSGMSRQSAEEAIQRLIKYTKIKVENYNIIQQYFPVCDNDSRVEVITVPNITVENDNIARQINNNMNKIVGQFEQNIQIKNVEDLYG